MPESKMNLNPLDNSSEKWRNLEERILKIELAIEKLLNIQNKTIE